MDDLQTQLTSVETEMVKRAEDLTELQRTVSEKTEASEALELGESGVE